MNFLIFELRNIFFRKNIIEYHINLIIEYLMFVSKQNTKSDIFFAWYTANLRNDVKCIYIYIYIYGYCYSEKKMQYDHTFLKHRIWTKYVYVYSSGHLKNILYNINLDLKDLKSIKFHFFAFIFFPGFNKN